MVDSVGVLVLSDTHLRAGGLDRMPCEVWELAARADLILHAGDITELCVIEELRQHGETVAVLGNNDHGLENELPETVELDIGGHSVAMIHGAGARSGRRARMRRRFPDAELVVFGHSHDPVDSQGEDGPRLFNPGSPTQRRRQPVHTVGWLTCTRESIESRHFAIGPLAR